MKQFFPPPKINTAARRLVFLSFLMLLIAVQASAASGQALLQKKVTLQVENLEVRQVLTQLEAQANVKFVYSSKIIPADNKVTLNTTNQKLADVMNMLFQPLAIIYKVSGQQIVLSKDKGAEVSAVSNPDLELLVTQALAVRDITGKVTDEKGEPLPGVTVLVKGTTIGTATNAEGVYNISTPDGAQTLVFSFIGFMTKEVAVGNATNLNVTLAADAKALEEVVVVGYGEVKKRDLTGSVVSVKGEEITKVPTTTVLEALQGKIPGADITRSNGYAGRNASIRIRGNRSITNPGSSNNPLYIVDGVQGVDASVINPNDIESVEVLKDASSTAIYGSRGANGVIIITTKRGTSDRPRFSLNAYTGISEVAGYGEYMTGPEYVAFRREAYRAAGNWTSPADDSKIGFNDKMLAAIQTGNYTDWTDLLINNGRQQDYQLGISGGGDKTKVYFSGNYYQENGILKNDEFKRYTGRLNVDQTINKWLKVGMQTQVAYTDNDQRRDPFNVASKIAPLGSPYNSDGTLDLFPAQGTEVNPLADEQPGAWKRNVQTTRGNVAVYLDINPIKNVTFKSTFAGNLTDTDQGHFNARNTIDGRGASSRSEITNSKNRFISWENVANFKKEVKEHSITLTGITSYISNIGTSNYSGGSNQLFENQFYYNLSGVALPYYGSNYTKNDLISYAGRLNYSWRGKYLLTLTGRTDGSSKLGPGNKWAFFPSGALAWRISDETFMQNIGVLNELKLRVSYGIAGNDAISPYGTQNSLSQIQLSWDEANLALAYGLNANIGNPALKWETTATTDIGLDFGILKNRISGTVDYYDAYTRDLIFNYNLPLSTGRGTIPRNIGKTRNRGIEVGITSNNITTSNFTWSTNVTFFKNKEEIVTLPNGNVIDNDYRRSLIIGQPAQVFYDYQKIGIWQLGEEAEAAKYNSIPGDIKVKDISGPDGIPDGKIDPQYDRTIIGTTVPKWTGGLNNNITYRGFDLNFLLFARVGQWASSDYFGKYRRNAQNNNPRVDYWTPENPTNDFPSPHATRTYNYITTTTLYETSYVKLRNVTFGYTLPKSLTTRFKTENLRFYVSGKNLLSFSKFNDFDPESEGITDQPLFRLYVAGVNVTF